MEWRPATDNDAQVVADIALGTDEASATEQASSFLKLWQVDLAIEDGQAVAAAAILPPSSSHHRGYGAWWDHGAKGAERFAEILGHLANLATAVPGLEVLQVSISAKDVAAQEWLETAGYCVAYPLWTMTHDAKRPLPPNSSLPRSVRMTSWIDTDLDRFHSAYLDAYQDQRVVEQYGRETWTRLLSNGSFADDLSRLMIDVDGTVIGFVLAFWTNDGGIELGPVGTIPVWRGNGISSALLSAVLTDCYNRDVSSITLTVDAASPTGAQRLYERLGFTKLEEFVAFHRIIRRPAQ